MIVGSGATFDLQATQTVASLDLDGTISRSSGTSALTVSGTSEIGGNITTSGNQTYSGTVSLTGTSILTSSGGAINFNNTVNGAASLTVNAASDFTVDTVFGGTTPLTALTIGTTSSTNTVTVDSTITVAGAISIYGGILDINETITSTNTGDLLFQSSTDGANSFDLASTKSISKTGGAESTLTIKSNGMIRGDGANITSVSGTPLNVVLWSNYDGDDSDGGISLPPKITTYGGDVWMGGSDAANGTSTWNGLTVGDGGSIGGAVGTNGNALDLNASIVTGGGDVWIRAGTTGSQLGLYTTTNVGDGEIPISINSGSGDVIIEADYVTTAQTGAIFEITSTGSFTFKPYANSFSSTYNGLNFQGTLSSGTFTGSDDFAEFKFNNFANLTGFTIGKSTNTADVTLSSAISIAGPITVYGGSIDVNSDLTATGGNAIDV